MSVDFLRAETPCLFILSFPFLHILLNYGWFSIFSTYSSAFDMTEAQQMSVKSIQSSFMIYFLMTLKASSLHEVSPQAPTFTDALSTLKCSAQS